MQNMIKRSFIYQKRYRENELLEQDVSNFPKEGHHGFSATGFTLPIPDRIPIWFGSMQRICRDIQKIEGLIRYCLPLAQKQYNVTKRFH